ncbi:MAG: chorismate-binding protein [Clostridium sp.]|nr:chorismate-binding protein [Clostridium sp.]
MLFNRQQRETISRLERQPGRKALLCAFPGEDFVMFADDAAGLGGFSLRHAGDNLLFGDFDGQTATLARCGELDGFPLSESTPRAEYLAAVSAIVDDLGDGGGKTVYSRIAAGTTGRGTADIADEYFSRFPETFRFILWTGEAVWIGASPELLADNDIPENRLRTMALAGTRRNGTDGNWDEKNLDEHRMVVDFIVDTLAGEGLDPEAGTTGTTAFGAVEHLRTPIVADASLDIRETLRRLSPTPALSGYPRPEALGRIRRLEHHRRGLYGGFICVSSHSPGRSTAYVNLRSVRLQPEPDGRGLRYNIYAGGGITFRSLPEEEWEETIGKTAILNNILRQTNDLHVESK